MLQFATILAKERPAINKAVDTLTNSLPDHVRPAAAYALGSGGKRLRPLLVVLMARAMGCLDDDVYILGATTELFHVATLLHDDILDNADLRRGHESTHRRFGVPRTLLTADAMFSRAFQALAETGDPRCVSCLCRAVIGTVDGEIMEIDNQGRTNGLEDYYKIIEGKTAYLLRASCELGAIKANADETRIQAACDYGYNLGMAFQIVDDALDFASSEKTGKPEGGDILEGKFTPPICYYMESLDPDSRKAFKSKFAALSFTEKERTAIVKAVRANGFQERTLRLADTFLDNASNALDCIAPETAQGVRAVNILREAVSFVRNRTS